MTRLPLCVIALLAAAPLAAQGVPVDRATALARAFARYDSVFRTQDPAAIAASFAPEGELGSVRAVPVVGPDSIAARLRQYAAFKLLASTLTADSSRISGDTARQAGHYWQRVRLPRGDTVEAHGTFTATWTWTNGAGWRIQRLITDP